MSARASMWRLVGKCLCACFGPLVAGLALAQGTLETNRPTFKDDEITLAFEFVWSAPQSAGSFVPVRVEVENPLNDDSGTLTVRSGTYVVHYPLEIPSRSLRSFLVYVPTADAAAETTLELRCRQTYLEARVESVAGAAQGQHDVALVSDSPSLIAFLRTYVVPIAEPGVEPQPYEPLTEHTFRDFVALPGRAPDRAVGYDGLKLVVLGEGAERMTDVEVGAIQRYVLSGGAVLFTGGAVSPVLRDPRWEAFLPGSDPRVMNVEGSAVLSEVTGYPLRGTMTVAALTPAPGTTGLKENGVPLLWYRRCGLGLAIYWAFDPFQAPVRTYAGRSKLFGDTVLNLGAEAEEFRTEIGVARQRPFEDSMYYGSTVYPSYPSETAESVFKVAMPPTGTVFLILAGYFVVVVPLNFLVLNRLGRGQLAWVTSPLIGLAFAGIFFYVARDLYGATLSRLTRGLVVSHEGSPVAYGAANQQLFFPIGGRYDLGLKGVEVLTTTSDFTSTFGGVARNTGFSDDLYDQGEILAPRAGVSNLGFREIHVEQAVPWGYSLPLTLKVERSGNDLRATGALTNDTPFDMTGATLWIGHRVLALGDLKSGETKGISELLALGVTSQRGYEQPPSAEGLVCLVANVQGLDVGSPIGKEQGGGTRLVHTYSSVSGGTS